MANTNDCKECGKPYPKTSSYNPYRLCNGCGRARLEAPGAALGDPLAKVDDEPTVRGNCPPRAVGIVSARKRAEALSFVMERKARALVPDSDRPHVRTFGK